MGKGIIIEDPDLIPPDAEKTFYEYFTELFSVDFEVSPSSGNSMDQELHSFLEKLVLPKKPDFIVLPCSLGTYHTEYIGIRLGLHIRLTREFGDLRFVPIIFYSPDSLQQILGFNLMASYVGSPGTFLVPDEFKMINHIIELKPAPLTVKEYYEFLKSVLFYPPEKFRSEHSIANEWGSYRLDKIAGTNVLNTKEFPGMYTLYFKWLDARNQGVRPVEEISIEEPEPIFSNKPVLTGPKLVDLDEDSKEQLKRNMKKDSGKKKV